MSTDRRTKAKSFPSVLAPQPVCPSPGGEEGQKAYRACSVLEAPSASLGALPPRECAACWCHLLCGPAWLLSEVTLGGQCRPRSGPAPLGLLPGLPRASETSFTLRADP